jgi:Holliday junction resolvase RusA-like endonuclease
MTRAIAFTVAGKPEPKGSTRGFVRRRRDGQFVADITSDNARSRSWQDAIGWAAKAAAPSEQPSTGPITLSIWFFLQQPGKAARLPTKKPDLDKLIRCVLDGLTGVVYRDDSQVVTVDAYKRYGSPPRAEIIVRELE